MVGGFARQAVPGLIALQATDPGDPNRYVMFAGQGGFGLPDEEYYRLDEYAAIRARYQAHVSAAFALAGIEDPDAQAQQVFDLETDDRGDPLGQGEMPRHPTDVQPDEPG